MQPLSPFDRAAWSRSHPPAPRHRALPRVAWAITVAVVVLGVVELVELVGSGL